MSVATEAGEPVAATVEEHRVTVSLVCSGVPRGAQIRRQVDVVRLHRSAGRVTRSERVPATALPLLVAGSQDVAGQVADSLFGDPTIRFAAGHGTLRWQSAAITMTRRPRAIVRLETSAGPALVGGYGTVADVLRDRVDDWARLLAEPLLPRDRAPGAWPRLPIVVRPPVAAALLVGVRWVLGSPAASRLDQRRVLPRLTLTDRPLAHDVGEPDDAGQPAMPWDLVRGGVVATAPRDGPTGLPAGRVVWHHDERRPVSARVFDLELAGPPGWPDADPQEEALELVECVERVRTYQPDGWMRLVCVARVHPGGRPFLVGVTGRPLSLLRAVVGATGEATSLHTEHSVRTPSLVLPSAQSLERSTDAQLTSL
ncbi:MAG TPA: hypothetical protein VI248_11195 [Kineosporiaceae bacterium]